MPPLSTTIASPVRTESPALIRRKFPSFVRTHALPVIDTTEATTGGLDVLLMIISEIKLNLDDYLMLTQQA